MALSKANETPVMTFTDITFKQKGSTTCYAGGVCVSAAGYAKPAVAATGLSVLGITKYDSANAGADGAKEVVVLTRSINGKRLVVKLANDGTDAVAQAHVGFSCYLVDDITVSSLATGRTAAGKVIRVDSDGVWVELAT